jgi:hypothetical protein
MQATSEIGKLKREIAVLRDVVGRPKPPLTALEKRTIKSEIERCIQDLDELRTKLGA